MPRHLERQSLSLSNSLWIALEPSITLAAVEGCHPRPLSTSNTMAALTLRRHILTLEKMVNANSQQKMLASKSLTLLTSPW